MEIAFTVRYTLREYLAIVGDYVVALGKENELKKNPNREPSENSPISLFFFRLFGSLAFMIKKARMPECEFRIDNSKIARTTKHGTITIEWNEIVNLHIADEGFILFKEKGGLPIPFRCISEEEREWIISRYSEIEA
jgi:hypothetical protein